MNMIISLYANNVGVPQTITKLSRIDSGSIPSNIPLGSIICPKELCCNSIVRYVRAIQNQSGAAIAVHFIADGQAQAIEFRVDEQTKHCGEALKDIKIRKNVLIVCITHNGKIEIPNGNSSFKKVTASLLSQAAEMWCDSLTTYLFNGVKVLYEL